MNISASPTHAEEPDLGELFHAAFRGLRRVWSRELAPFEMTPHQWRALNALGRHGACLPEAPQGTTAGAPTAATAPEGALRLKELAGFLRIAPRSATEVVDQLEAKDLVERLPDPNDRRAVLVGLTDGGRQVRDGVQRARREQANQYFSRLAPGERDELARLLAILADGDGCDPGMEPAPAIRAAVPS